MQKKFEQSVTKLKNQVEQLDDSKGEIKKTMNALIDDLQHQIEHPEDNDHLQKLNAKVPEFIAKFELEHPKLAETLNEIMVILSNMGI